MVHAVQEAGEEVEGVGVEATGSGGQDAALQGLAEPFRGEGGQVQFGSGAANLKAKRDSVPLFLNYRFQSLTV